jgi:peptidoglycan/LPS O-acetylase OafA/YrhL
VSNPHLTVNALSSPEPARPEIPQFDSPSRIAAIDGLRGLAVVLVMAYHFDLGLPGGFIGVDLFFSISGFVVVRRLLYQFEASTESTKALLKGFFIGRFWRLFPALAVMVVVVVGLSQFMNPVLGRPGRNVVHGFAAFAGLANWFRLLHPDQLSEVARPLLHTWSLSIEEQFYVCIPLALAAFRRNARTAAYAMGGLCVAVSVLPLPSSDPTERYFFTLARLAPLGFGVLLAAFLHRPFSKDLQAPEDHSLNNRSENSSTLTLAPETGTFNSQRRVRVTDAVVVVLGLLLLPTLRWSTWNASWLFPLGLALLGLFSAGLIGLLTLDRYGAVSAVLESKPAQYLGSRSYSLYLWHFPVAHLFMSQPRSLRTLAWVTLSFLLAELSYRVIERPLRKFGASYAARNPQSSTFSGTNSMSPVTFGRIVQRIPLLSTSCFFLIGLFALFKK